MQYQVYKKGSGEIIAWIDTESPDTIHAAGYDVKAGENLEVRDVNGKVQITRGLTNK